MAVRHLTERKAQGMTKRLALLSLVLGALGFWAGATPALAAACYSPDEIAAEQTLRLHSELMVITVTCHYSSTGQDLVGAYTGFTRKNITRLHDAEQTMIRHYEKTSGKGAVSRLDRLRTLLANEYGQQIANVSAPAFCANERDKVIAMYNGGDDQLTGAVSSLTVGARTYEPACQLKSAKLARKQG